jgi:MurNAc alpha-1-phosphate uridylyltransferase
MWIDGVRSNLLRLAETFDPARMDILLLMAPTASSIGYGGRGDYAMLPDGALRARREHQVVPFVYAGAAIMSPSIFAKAPKGDFSLTKMFDAANEQERLFGLRLDGVWMHVGTPDAVGAAEEAFLESVA